LPAAHFSKNHDFLQFFALFFEKNNRIFWSGFKFSIPADSHVRKNVRPFLGLRNTRGKECMTPFSASSSQPVLSPTRDGGGGHGNSSSC
jgi:hypothetical protein